MAMSCGYHDEHGKINLEPQLGIPVMQDHAMLAMAKEMAAAGEGEECDEARAYLVKLGPAKRVRL